MKRRGSQFVVKFAKAGPDGREVYRTTVIRAATLFGAFTVSKHRTRPGERPVLIAVAGYH